MTYMSPKMGSIERGQHWACVASVLNEHSLWLMSISIMEPVFLCCFVLLFHDRFNTHQQTPARGLAYTVLSIEMTSVVFPPQ